MTKSQEVFYVGLQDPKEVRRNVLESTRDVVLLLRSYENLKQIRTEKAEAMAKVKHQIKDLNKTIAKLKKNLPKTRLREDKSGHPKKKAGGVRKPVTANHNDIGKLEDELGAIEAKLQALQG